MSNPLDVFLELQKLPTYSSAQFQSRNGQSRYCVISLIKLLVTHIRLFLSAVIRVTSKFPDFDRNCYRTCTTTYVVAGEEVFTTFSPDMPEIVLSALSDSGKRLAIFREVTGSSSTKRFVEIWKNSVLEAVCEVTETHGAFYTDGSSERIVMVEGLVLTNSLRFTGFCVLFS